MCVVLTAFFKKSHIRPTSFKKMTGGMLFWGTKKVVAHDLIRDQPKCRKNGHASVKKVLPIFV